ncbi:MAG: hypothetical protein ACXACY_24665, partial [Candidatus Hodarchaeales archaeon]
KTALSVLGYKADGTKNWFGNTIGTGNVLTDHYVPKWIAGKDSDVGQVIDSAESENWSKQINTAKLALNVISLGAAGGATGGASAAAGAGASAGASAGTSTAAQVGTTGAITAAGNTGQTMMSNAAEKTAKDASMDALNSGYSEQTIDGVTTTTVGGVELSEEDIADWEKYLKENPEGTIEGFKAEKDEADQLNKAAKKTKAIPIVGDIINLVADRKNIDKKLKDTKKELRSQKSLQTFNYL